MSMYGIIPILQVYKVLRKTVLMIIHSYVKNKSVTKIPVIDPLCIICTREIATMEWAIIFYIHNR